MEEILFSLDDDTISLHVGAPDPSLLPIDLLQSTIPSCIQQANFDQCLQYGPSLGSASYREALAEFLSIEYKCNVSADNLMVTSGASQSLFNLVSIFTDANTVFIVENPTYFLALKVLADHGISLDSLIKIPNTEFGLDVDELQRILESRDHGGATCHGNVKKYRYFLYTVPTFGNPTGSTLSKNGRMKLLELARKYDILVVCDDVYQLLHFDNLIPPERIVSLDLISNDGFGNIISNCS
jgi:DNA-binding transcriptional MocR family regulator